MTFKDRFDHSIEMQQAHALEYYKDFFDVERVIEVDILGESNRDMKVLDFSGIDKLIITKNKITIHIAQRFRRDYNKNGEWRTPDFSLRFKSYSDTITEYEKVKKAHYGLASMPTVYGFGRMPYGRKVAIENGFDEFYLINLEALASAHFDGPLSAEGPKPNGDGSKGLYFDLDDLRQHGCIIHEWPERKSNLQTPQPTKQEREKITSWSVTNES
jgi:hypothetical protein